jgi:3-oxosteroid 1-dehydrogenase
VRYAGTITRSSQENAMSASAGSWRLRTDSRARVLREDGTPIEGLYAAGNASASVMGHSYAGAGATIGPAMTFGYIAARTMAAGCDGAGDNP